jgi:2,3-bisphosphoglycerate-dependent phosphoglycerate mutase
MQARIADERALPAAAARSPGVRIGTLTLLRHGESEFNRARRFTGWADVDLTTAGEAEAAHAGRVLRNHGYAFDCCFTSALRRAARSGEIVLRTMGLEHIAIEQSWRLNERHYGALQGLGPWSAMRRYGVLPVLRARREYAYRPPALRAHAAMDPCTAGTSPDEPPTAESLADMRARLVPFWHARIKPELARGRSVLVVSHKHTLRALYAVLAGRDRGERPIRVPTGVPIVLTLDPALRITERRALRVAASR